MKIGDKVAVIDDTIAGVILKINDKTVTIETEDGFELEFTPAELIALKGVSKREFVTMDINSVLSQKSGDKRKAIKEEKNKKKYIPAMEVDLHINQLVRSTKFMEKHDMLNLQMDTAQRQLEFAISKRFQRVVFIHGVGEGVLKAELETLFRRYDTIKFYDADYQKYGRGATEVYIFQNPQKNVND